MRRNKSKIIIFGIFLLSIWAGTTPKAMSQEPPLVSTTYVPSGANIPNPERGFCHWKAIADLWGLDQIRTQGHTMILLQILANQYRNRSFDQPFLQAVQASFDQARKQGIKVIPRVAYNNGPPDGADAPMSIVLAHIQQMGVLWKKNKDVIAFIDAGFIGQWGEWHDSSNGLDSLSNKSAILHAILRNSPVDRDVTVRSPRDIRAIFKTNQSIPAKEAFNGSDFSRVGDDNDCFLSNDSDMGTYPGGTRAQELTYIGGSTMYVPWGGETCHYDPTYCPCSNALQEMRTLHCSVLNRDYEPNVIQHWQAEGCYPQIENGLGYRFVLLNAQLPDKVKPGGILKINVQLKNEGFGQLYNRRPAQLVLRDNSTSAESVADINLDPRWWQSRGTYTIQKSFRIPAKLKQGNYKLLLRMPDASPSIASDPRYSIQFANQGTWVAETGSNLLKDPLEITNNAVGSIDSSAKIFQEMDKAGKKVP